MKANNIIIVPETHWDREWYLPFQEFRARLVIMMDKLLEILRSDPEYKNFTLDGQTIPLEDYLEVRPEKKEEIKKFVKEKRLSVGPMYILPDEFLVSGESMIRNLFIGHQIANKFGRVMKAGYIPDPFGHIAQLPQILSGFEIPSVLFWRGFGNEFEENNLNLEFIWNAPGIAASILGIFLKAGYGSVADLDTRLKEGKYKRAIVKINRVVKYLEKFTITPYVLLNSGSDHHEARPEIPEIVKQWNEQYPDKLMKQNDFEYYVNKVLEAKPILNSYQGELRGGKYAHLLSGVFSARMWIKQRNTEIEYLYVNYTEPLSTITWALDKYSKFTYPQTYILTGLKWLIKNHPHDSICGCSIDLVHDEMKTRFDWSEQIGNEIFKSSFLYLTDLIKINTQDKKQITLIVYNPLPWKRKDILQFNGITYEEKGQNIIPEDFKIIDSDGNEIEFQKYYIKEEPRFTQEKNISHRYTFLANIPACGYKVYYLIRGEKAKEFSLETDDFKLIKESIENKFYKISITDEGQINVFNKESGEIYENICQFEESGDWGDEYDFSKPRQDQTDSKYFTKDAKIIQITPFLNGPTQKTIKIQMNLKLPISLTEDRYKREEILINNKINLYISLYKEINRIDFKIELENRSKDHRIRVLFPSKIKTDKVHADGHFYVVPRDINIPEVKKWIQKPLPTNHQKDFVAISDDSKTFAVLNKGLPEYEAMKNGDGTITLAITLLRCNEWLSRGDFASRMALCGPNLNTPGAQCLGKHEFELSLIIEENKSTWFDSEIHIKGKEFNNPLTPIFPIMTKTPLRIIDKIILKPLGVLSLFLNPYVKTFESYLPSELSFLEIDNKNILLSALKKSEEGNYLIARCYNISSNLQTAKLTFCDYITIKSAEIVNFLEEIPDNEIKARISMVEDNNLNITLEPHVIATIKIDFNKQ